MKLLYKVFFVLECSWLGIDTINGMLLRIDDSFGLFGKVIRGLFMLVALLTILLDPKSRKQIIVPILLFFIISTTVLITTTHRIGFLPTHIKLLSIPILVELIRLQILRHRLTPWHFTRIIYFNLFFLVFNIGASLLGYGYTFYHSGIGGRGFFFAGNEVAVTYLGLSTLIIWYISSISRGKYFKWLILLLLALLGIGILNKTAIIGFFLLFSYTFLINQPKKLIAMGLLTSSIFFLFQDFFLLKFDQWFGRVDYFIRNYGIEVVIFGGAKRLNYIMEVTRDFFEQPWLFVIGRGWNGEAENNVFDLLEAFGVPGLIFYGLWFYYLLNFINLSSINGLFKQYRLGLIVFGFLLITYISIFAGHTLQSNMFSIFPALMLGIPYLILEDRSTV